MSCRKLSTELGSQHFFEFSVSLHRIRVKVTACKVLWRAANPKIGNCALRHVSPYKSPMTMFIRSLHASTLFNVVLINALDKSQIDWFDFSIGDHSIIMVLIRFVEKQSSVEVGKEVFP